MGNEIYKKAGGTDNFRSSNWTKGIMFDGMEALGLANIEGNIINFNIPCPHCGAAHVVADIIGIPVEDE